MMFTPQSKWLLCRARPLSEDVSSSAVNELMLRRAALRAEPCVPRERGEDSEYFDWLAARSPPLGRCCA